MSDYPDLPPVPSGDAPQWEYTTHPMPKPADPGNPSAELVRDLNAMGYVGWELVQIVDGMMIFKAPLASKRSGVVY